MERLDVLALTAHPDDAELGCGGTLLKLAAAGKAVGVVDLTRGELGTRGAPALRAQEAAAAADILGLVLRDNLGLRDGFFANDEACQMAVVKVLRAWRPMVVITNAPEDRHPDHGRGARLVTDACFLSGLRKIETLDEEGRPQAPWRPKRLCRMVQDRFLRPSFVVNITETFARKIEAIKAYRSQFHDPESDEPETYISQSGFLEGIEARAREMGRYIGATYGEGFITDNPVELPTPLFGAEDEERLV